MAEEREYTRYQLEVIRRYYENLDAITRTRLAELVSDAYLAEGKKANQVWRNIERLLVRIQVPEVTVRHIVDRRDVEALAKLVQRLNR